MMAKALSFTAKATVPVAACFLAASLVGVARAQDKAQLTGHWNFNQNLSDDARQKVREAQQNSHRPAGTAGRSYPGSGGVSPGSYPGVGVDEPVGSSGGARVGNPDGIGGDGRSSPIGGAGGGVNYPGGTGREPGTAGGHGGPDGQGNHGNGGGHSVWDRLSQNPKFLQIDQHAKQIVISDDSGYSLTYYADGKKHEEKDASGKKISTKSVWEGKSLVAESRLSPSEKLTESFRLSQDGSQLYVKTRFETSSLEEPLSIRRVYELGKAPAN